MPSAPDDQDERFVLLVVIVVGTCSCLDPTEQAAMLSICLSICKAGRNAALVLTTCSSQTISNTPPDRSNRAIVLERAAESIICLHHGSPFIRFRTGSADWSGSLPAVLWWSRLLAVY